MSNIDLRRRRRSATPCRRLTLPPINRTTLALFAGASGDHNQIHIDIDFARQAGMPDVFAHGMLSMAYLGRLLTQWVDQRQLRQLRRALRRHHASRPPDHLQRRVVEKFEVDGERRASSKSRRPTSTANHASSATR